jgi:hypothetical protein
MKIDISDYIKSATSIKGSLAFPKNKHPPRIWPNDLHHRHELYHAPIITLCSFEVSLLNAPLPVGEGL